jgi:exo-beta-1,3-glucanase (GH17 family)
MAKRSARLALVSVLSLGMLALASGCATSSPSAGRDGSQATASGVGQAFDPMFDGVWAGDAICYGPHRDGQGPGTPDQPTAENIAEDARIMAKSWRFVRMYGVGDATEHFLQAIEREKLPLKLFMGVWIAPEAEFDKDGKLVRVLDENIRLNNEQVAGAIRLANKYPKHIAAIGVGNETQVYWSTYRTASDVLIKHIRAVKAGVPHPVTTCDSYEFWLTPESVTIAKELDFAAVHIYAMWNKQQLEDAIVWSRTKLAEVQAKHPNMQFVITELGWATDRGMNGYQAEGIVGKWGEGPQETFFRTWRDYARTHKIPYFWFQAFDEKWKGGTEPNEVEKHWGVYFSNRKPKQVMQHELPRDASTKR